jgi:hypothetical protein
MIAFRIIEVEPAYAIDFWSLEAPLRRPMIVARDGLEDPESDVLLIDSDDSLPDVASLYHMIIRSRAYWRDGVYQIKDCGLICIRPSIYRITLGSPDE